LFSRAGLRSRRKYTTVFQIECPESPVLRAFYSKPFMKPTQQRHKIHLCDIWFAQKSGRVENKSCSKPLKTRLLAEVPSPKANICATRKTLACATTVRRAGSRFAIVRLRCRKSGHTGKNTSN